jgi:hypothetical protein
MLKLAMLEIRRPSDFDYFIAISPAAHIEMAIVIGED